MKKIVIIILFLGLGPAISGSTQNTFYDNGIKSVLLEKITPVPPSGKLEVVNIINDDIWLGN